MISDAPEYACCLQTLELLKQSASYSKMLRKAQRLRTELEKLFSRGAVGNPAVAAMCPLGHFVVSSSQAEKPRCGHTLASMKGVLKNPGPRGGWSA